MAHDMAKASQNVAHIQVQHVLKVPENHALVLCTTYLNGSCSRTHTYGQAILM